MKKKLYDNIFHFNNAFSDPVSFDNILLYQIGDLQCQGTSIIPLHTQHCCEITFISSGTGQDIINGFPIQMIPQNIHIDFLGDTHTIIADKQDPVRYFFLGFDLKEAHPLYPILAKLKTKLDKTSLRLIRDFYDIDKIFMRALTEYTYFNEFSIPIIQACVNQIIAYSFKNFLSVPSIYKPNIDNSDVLLYNITSYLDQNALDINCLKNMPSQLGYSYSHLSHLFSTKMTKSLKEYCIEVRLNYAKEQLEKKLNNVTEIAELLGYSSIHPFSKAFKNYFHFSPTSI